MGSPKAKQKLKHHFDMSDEEKQTDEKIVPMQGQEPSLEDKINAIVQQTVSREQFNQVAGTIGDQLEKLNLRLRLLEQKDYSFTDDLVNRMREMMVAELEGNVGKVVDEG